MQSGSLITVLNGFSAASAGVDVDYYESTPAFVT